MQYKYFIFSDVHGHYTELMNALAKANFDINNNSHIIVSLGDNFDRGIENYEVFKFLKDLPKERKRLIKGNHEDLFLDLAKRPDCPYNLDFHNGTAQAYREFEIWNVVDDVKALIWEMEDYMQLGDYILTHGFIPNNGLNASVDEWNSARWTNTEKIYIHNSMPDGNETYIFGHFGTRHFYQGNGMFYCTPKNGKSGLLAIDGTTTLTKNVNILVIEQNETNIDIISKIDCIV